MKISHYYNPVHTVQGRDSLNELHGLVKENFPENCRILILAWSDRVFQLEAMKKLEKDGHQVQNLCFCQSNPTVEQLYDAYCRTREFSPQLVIAVGGGSVMDVGKSLCCLYGKEIEDEDGLRRLIQEKAFGKPQARWIGVPTTAGTGSEVTCWATIWDPSRDVKRSVESQDNYAFAAVADSALLEEMPLKLAVSSALDAVAHAAESYWARHTNMVSRELALGAIETVMGNMDRLLEGDERALDEMSKGSMLAGLAFSDTKTTACHSISYPLTMHAGIPHGTAVSLLLAPVAEINEEAVEQKERLYKALGVSDVKELDARVKDILTRGGFPVTLSQWNIKKEELRHLAELGITKGRADNNPVDLDPEKIQAILEKIYE